MHFQFLKYDKAQGQKKEAKKYTTNAVPRTAERTPMTNVNSESLLAIPKIILFDSQIINGRFQIVK